jgi:LacI family transcriptional regulator
MAHDGETHMDAVTISDVARLAGVSESTVSRVMSASRPVTPSIEAAVRKAAADLGYSGNSIARALRRKQTDTIGMVVPSILNPFFTTLVDSMERVLHSQGKVLFLCDSRQDPEVEADHLRSLIERHVDGIVVSPCHEELSRPAVATSAARTALVQLDRWVSVDDTDWVGIDDDAAMSLVLNYLKEHGARSAAFVTSEFTNSSTHDRLNGFERHARALGIETRPEWIVLGDFSVASGRSAGYRLLQGAKIPDAIVCADDLIAFGVLQAARMLGIEVPGRVQVTGFDNLEFAEHVEPPLTSIDQPTTRMAEEVMRLLEKRKAGESDGGTRVALAPHLVLRSSTR